MKRGDKVEKEGEGKPQSIMNFKAIGPKLYLLLGIWRKVREGKC